MRFFRDDLTRYGYKGSRIYDGAGVPLSMELRKDGYVPMENNTWFIGRNAADSGNINMFMVDSSDYIRFGCNIYADDWDGSNTNILLGVGVAGAGNLSGATNSVFLGYQSGYSITSGDDNYFIGYQAGYYNQTGSKNVIFGYQAGMGASGQNYSGVIFVGYRAGYRHTTGYYNVGIGESALEENTSGHENIGIGFRCLWKTTTGYENFAIGVSALALNTTGYRNIAFGNLSLYNNTTGFGNVSMGYRNLYSCTTGYENFAFGSETLYNLTSGNRNVGIGHANLKELTTARYCLAIGYESGKNNTGGWGEVAIGYMACRGTASNSPHNNVAVGREAMYVRTTAIHNVSIGMRSGYSLTSANYNVLVGTRAGNSLTSGSNNVLLGYEAGYTLATDTGGIHIGYQAGYYETGAEKFYITNQQGSNEADGRTKALMYGVMSATTANQTLDINALLTVNNGVIGQWFAGTEVEITSAGNGGTNDGVDVSGVDIIRCATAGGDIYLGGLDNGTDGQRVYIYKSGAANNLVIEHKEGHNEDIICGDALDATYTDYGGMIVIYRATSGEWFEVSRSAI